MTWLSSFLHPAGLLSAARLPLQVAVLTYVGAGGLAGAAVVGGVMLSPAREVVQEAVAPARHFVESVMPDVPSMFPTDPRQAVASQPIVSTRPLVSVPGPISESAPLTVDDLAVEDVVAEAAPIPQARAVSPVQSGLLAPPAVQPAQPTLTPSVAEPIAAIERAGPVMPGRPAAAIVVPSVSRPEVAPAPARATAVSVATRVAISGANNDSQRAAAVAPPAAIPVRVQTSRSEPTPTASAVPTPRPTSVPAAAPTATPIEVRTQTPTQAPTVAPTQVPTRAPTSVPTQEPKKTAVPTRTAAPSPVPTKSPPRPANATPVPARAVAAATPAKEEEHSTTATRRHPSEPLGRTADAPPPHEHEGD